MTTTNTFIDLLIAAQGLIINISSLSALVPLVFCAAYASSKAALASYSRVLRAELRPLGVRVQCVMAGCVKSNIDQGSYGSVLPEQSLYQRARYLWEDRLGFSQKPESGPLETKDFARKLVNAALRFEVPVYLRSWVGMVEYIVQAF